MFRVINSRVTWVAKELNIALAIVVRVTVLVMPVRCRSRTKLALVWQGIERASDASPSSLGGFF